VHVDGDATRFGNERVHEGFLFIRKSYVGFFLAFLK